MTAALPTPTAADRETARQLLSDFEGQPYDGLYVTRLARMFAEQRAAGHAAGLAAAIAEYEAGIEDFAREVSS